MIKVLFFASFREKLKCEELLVDEGSYPELLSSLKSQLAEKGDDWREVMMSERTLVAVNQTMTRKDVSLKSGDEVAFFPPVTGG
ncbi:molybdopterin converting factor subunit 1 [uncultured Endozoicomonas sp.]|uniref:molybdopterin converting factor subunit 1 n=1 Tax=uncultured Endozoicomonas sp. TaxID=432652 RepID=UPI00260B9192|nr:molybdopterin converting factor subunit 1 [uncultured Endozoicomonas sp.]